MNGGIEQPGCSTAFQHNQSLFVFNFLYINKAINLFFYECCRVSPGTGSCNHDRAPIYFAESINSEAGFWGFKCKEWKDWAIGLCRNSMEQAIMGWKAINEYVLYVKKKKKKTKKQ